MKLTDPQKNILRTLKRLGGDRKTIVDHAVLTADGMPAGWGGARIHREMRALEDMGLVIIDRPGTGSNDWYMLTGAGVKLCNTLNGK